MLSLIEERYAKSLYELALEDGNTLKLLEELLEMQSIFKENPEFLKLLASPVMAFSEKRELVGKVFLEKLNPLTENTLLFMIEKGRVSAFPGMCEMFKSIYNEENGICEATVITAVEITEDEKVRLSESLSKKTAKKVNIVTMIDKSIMGGVIVKIGNEQIDSSIKGKLDELAAQMK